MTYRRGNIDVYVLHITLKDGQVVHYVGATKKNRFRIRLAEHERGKGSSLTRLLSTLGATFEGGIAAFNVSPIEEYLIQLQKERYCRICNAQP